METYYLWTVQAFHTKTPEGALIDVVGITVIANSEKEALEKAQKMVERPNYRLSGVTEFRSDQK